jgi:RND family efflux transporter MFP subunit
MGPCVESHEVSPQRLVVAPVTYRPVKRTIEAAGTLYGCEEVSICATAEGRVVRLRHDVADHVRPGEELLEVDPIDYELAVRQADKALLVELAKLGLQAPPLASFDLKQLPMVVEAKVKSDNCKSHFERSQLLFVHKAVTEEELLDKQVEYRMAEAEYENQVSLAKAELATIQEKQEMLAIAEQRLADTIVKAPAAADAVPDARDAVYAVSKRSVIEGSYVHPGAEIYRLVIDSTLELRVAVPDSRSSEIRSGQSVQVSVAGAPRAFAGAVMRIGPTVDPATRTCEVEVQVPNADGMLKVGGIATATILTHVDRDAATVPSDAPLTSDGVTKLLLADGEHFKPVAVTLGAKSTDWVEVLRPALPRGTRVVTNGQLALVAGGDRR